MTIEQNISRLEYLLASYKMTVGELLRLINEGLKTPLDEKDILSTGVKLNTLKRIDKVFNKGLHFYMDPKLPELSQEASVFFRKAGFGTELNIGAKKIVHQFEELKISLSAISKLAELTVERSLPAFTLSHDPKTVAQQVRRNLYPEFHNLPKEFLRGLISTFAENNILVFEFVETWNKKEKANIDGFFLSPNVIVLKRQQTSFRREIFTLVHELGHYLLNEEEVEQLELSNFGSNKLSAIERWCNDFAYLFLAGEFDKEFDTIERAESSNDFHHDLIKDISNKTHLSPIALFTKLLYQKKISQSDYNAVKSNFDEQFRIRQEKEQMQKELDKSQGKEKGGSTPKPMISPLLVSTVQAAFYEGVIGEKDVCDFLNISPNKLEKYLP